MKQVNTLFEHVFFIILFTLFSLSLCVVMDEMKTIDRRTHLVMSQFRWK